MADFQLTVRIEKTGEKEAMNALNDLDKQGRRIVEGVSAATGKALGDVAVAYERGSKTIRQQLKNIADDHYKIVDAILAEEKAQARAAAAQADSAERIATRNEHAIAGASRGLEMLGRTGELTGRSLDAVIGNISQMAFAFGPGGQLVAAIGISTAAIVEMFMRTKREMTKAVDDAENEFHRLARAGDREAIKSRIKELVGGDPYGDSDEDVAGIDRARARQRQLQARLTALGGPQGAAIDAMSRVLGAHNGPNSNAFDRALISGELEDIDKFLQKVTPEVVQLQGRLRELNKKKSGEDAKKADDAATAEFEKWFRLQERQIKGLSLSGELTASQVGWLQDQSKAFTATAKALDLTNPKYERYLALAKQIDDLLKKNGNLPDVVSRANAGSALAPGANPRDALNASLLQGLLPTKEQTKTELFEIDQLVAETLRTDPFLNSRKELQREAAQLAGAFSRTLADSLATGIETAFSSKSFGAGFKALTATLLDGLGNMAIAVGASFISFGSLVDYFVEALNFLSGGNMIVAGLELIALGALLKAAGGGIASGIGHGGAGGGSSASTGSFLSFGVPASGTSVPVTTQSPPAAREQINLMVIGDGPKVQRDLATIMNSANRRNLLEFAPGR